MNDTPTATGPDPEKMGIAQRSRFEKRKAEEANAIAENPTLAAQLENQRQETAKLHPQPEAAPSPTPVVDSTQR